MNGSSSGCAGAAPGYAIWKIILARGVFEKVDDTLAKLGAQKLYQALTVSDQAQIREFYLSQVEEVEPAAADTKFQQLYRYY